MNNQDLELVIAGGGIMGLFTAYHALQAGITDITIIERYTIGNDRRAPDDPKAASFSLTRSFRSDYIDPYYAQLAHEAGKLWRDFEQAANVPCLIATGCLNLASKSVTPDLDATYAMRSFLTMSSLAIDARCFPRDLLESRYPQFDVDLGCLDVGAGVLYLPAITGALLQILQDRGVRFLEDTLIARITTSPDDVALDTNNGPLTTGKLVITSGLWTNDVVQTIDGCTLRFPLTPDRPSQCKYYIPPSHRKDQFMSDCLPVFAYLDVGIYGHPIYEDRTPGVKIGFYNPPGRAKDSYPGQQHCCLRGRMPAVSPGCPCRRCRRCRPVLL